MPVLRWEVSNKFENEQNRGPKNYKIFAKEKQETPKDPQGHSIDTYQGFLFLCNCDDVGCGIQTEQGQHRRCAT